MAGPPVIADLRAALLERRFPTVMVWNRLEGRPRTSSSTRALRAEVRDALWMLTRQWQLGRVPRRGRRVAGLGDVPPPDHPARRAIARRRIPRRRLPGGQPLEAIVEARQVPFTIGPDRVGLDLRVAMGRRWMKLMAAAPPCSGAAARAGAGTDRRPLADPRARPADGRRRPAGRAPRRLGDAAGGVRAG